MIETTEERMDIKNVLEPKLLLVVTALMGLLLALALFRLSNIVTSQLNLGKPLTGNYMVEMILIGGLLSVVVGHYIGKSLVNGEKTNTFLAGFFATFLILTGISQPSIVFLLAVIAGILAMSEYFGLINMSGFGGKVTDFSSKILVTFLGGYINLVEIQPTMSIYVGKGAYSSWILVALLFIGLMYSGSGRFKLKLDSFFKTED